MQEEAITEDDPHSSYQRYAIVLLFPSYIYIYIYIYIIKDIF